MKKNYSSMLERRQNLFRRARDPQDWGMVSRQRDCLNIELKKQTGETDRQILSHIQTWKASPSNPMAFSSKAFTLTPGSHFWPLVRARLKECFPREALFGLQKPLFHLPTGYRHTQESSQAKRFNFQVILCGGHWIADPETVPQTWKESLLRFLNVFG